MYKLLATDIDDTLLARDGSLPRTTRRTLQALHRAGVVIVFSSGRAASSMRPLMANIIEPADDEYFISYNGGRVSTVLSESIIFEQKLSSPLVAEIMEYLRSWELYVQGYSDQRFVIEKNADPMKAEGYAKGTGMGFDRVDNMAHALPDGTVKLLVIDNHEDLRKHQKNLKRIAAGRFDVVFSKPIYLEIIGAEVSKGKALSVLSEHLGIPLEHCIAFGDSSNDIEMLETAGLGVAVANARNDLKAVADVVLKHSADESALTELAERYFPHINVLN